MGTNPPNLLSHTLADTKTHLHQSLKPMWVGGKAMFLKRKHIYTDWLVFPLTTHYLYDSWGQWKDLPPLSQELNYSTGVCAGIATASTVAVTSCWINSPSYLNTSNTRSRDELSWVHPACDIMFLAVFHPQPNHVRLHLFLTPSPSAVRSLPEVINLAWSFKSCSSMQDFTLQLMETHCWLGNGYLHITGHLNIWYQLKTEWWLFFFPISEHLHCPATFRLREGTVNM